MDKLHVASTNREATTLRHQPKSLDRSPKYAASHKNIALHFGPHTSKLFSSNQSRHIPSKYHLSLGTKPDFPLDASKKKNCQANLYLPTDKRQHDFKN